MSSDNFLGINNLEYTTYNGIYIYIYTYKKEDGRYYNGSPVKENRTGLRLCEDYNSFLMKFSWK